MHSPDNLATDIPILKIFKPVFCHFVILTGSEFNITIFESFKGLFRKSRKSDPQTKEHYYTLQLRYARRWLGEDERQRPDGEASSPPVDSADDDDPEFREPLEAGYLTSLLGFISNMVEQEQASKRQSRANWATFIAAVVAAFAATAAAIISYASRPITP